MEREEKKKEKEMWQQRGDGFTIFCFQTPFNFQLPQDFFFNMQKVHMGLLSLLPLPEKARYMINHPWVKKGGRGRGLLYFVLSCEFTLNLISHIN